MPLKSIVDDVSAALRESRSAVEACQLTITALIRHTPAMMAALLHVQDHLRCVAATGSWQVFSSLPLGTGVTGRVYASGVAEAIEDVSADPDYIRLGPDVSAEICVPVVDRTGQPIGALNLEWTKPIDVAEWKETLIAVGLALGARVEELGGPPPETQGEQLLRHAVALTSADSDAELLIRACRAAREITGLAAAVLIRPGAAEGEMLLAASSPEPRDRPLVARLAQVDPEELANLVAQAGRHGASYTLGDPAMLDAHGFESLTEAGVRTMIVVPLGVGAPGGALVALDEATVRPEPATVNMLELLAGQAATCLDRLANVRRLHRQANSDPLTGLRHGGPFMRRLANATPGRTALLAIDIDQFKLINDTQGHAAGDRAIIELAVTLQKALRQGDELFRVGGDEFVAVLDVPSAQVAFSVAQRLVTATRTIGQTISVGVALQTLDETPQQTLHRADQALYAVKRAGRDGAQLAED